MPMKWFAQKILHIFLLFAYMIINEKWNETKEETTDYIYECVQQSFNN